MYRSQGYRTAVRCDYPVCHFKGISVTQVGFHSVEAHGGIETYRTAGAAATAPAPMPAPAPAADHLYGQLAMAQPAFVVQPAAAHLRIPKR